MTQESSDAGPLAADRVHRVGFVGNLGLAAVKLGAGSLAGSPAVIADGVHSLADAVVAVALWLGCRWSARPPDDDHHFGHGNGEALASVLVGLLIISTGLGLIYAGLASHRTASANIFGALAIAAEGLTVAVKLWLARMTRRAAKALASPALGALTRDNQSDALTSALVLTAVATTLLGGPWWIESVATAAVGLLILRMGVSSAREGLDILMDRVSDPTLREQLRGTAASVDGVGFVEAIRVHPIGGELRVELVIRVPEDLTIAAADALAQRVEGAIVSTHAGVRGVHIHLRPLA